MELQQLHWVLPASQRKRTCPSWTLSRVRSSATSARLASCWIQFTRRERCRQPGLAPAWHLCANRETVAQNVHEKYTYPSAPHTLCIGCLVLEARSHAEWWAVEQTVSVSQTFYGVLFRYRSSRHRAEDVSKGSTLSAFCRKRLSHACITRL